MIKLKHLLIFLFVIAMLVGCEKATESTDPGTNPTNPEKPKLHTIIDGCDTDGTPFGAGDGGLASPYLVCSSEHIKNIQTTTDTNAYYKQVIDIDLKGVALFPVTTFNGVYEGNGRVLSNFSGNGPLFANLSGTVQNLTLSSVNIHTASRSGSLVGWVGVAGKVTNCSVSGAFRASYAIGGLIGQNDGEVNSCTSSVTITGFDYVGGLVGVNRGIIANSHSTGTVTALGGTQTDDHAGGLIGQNLGGTVTKSYATGGVTGQDYTGGLVGENAGGTISGCFSANSVLGLNRVGGLVGANGAFTIPSAIINSYSTSSVVALSLGAGLVGQSTDTVTNCYSTGMVSGTGSGMGGLIGNNTGTVNSSYWDVNTSTRATSSGGNGQTSSEMQTQSTFAGWDFTSVWNPPSSSYPSLR